MMRKLTHVHGKELLEPIILYVACNDDDKLVPECPSFFAVSERYHLNVSGIGDTMTEAVENFGLNMLDHYHNLKQSKDEHMTGLEIMERTLLDTVIGEDFNGREN